MKNILFAVCVIAVGTLFSALANAQNCGSCQVNSQCGNGSSCCYHQYPNGTISCNFCKTGSCYTSSTTKDLASAKELDATALKESKLAKTGEAMSQTGEASAKNCGPCQVDSDCGSGRSCCYTQYSNGSISCNFCKTGSCYTTSMKKDLTGAMEFDATTFKEGKSPK